MEYNRAVYQLRKQRSLPEWEPENDRSLLASLEELFDSLTEEEQKQVNLEGWKSWPDLYEESLEFLIENPDVGLGKEQPARIVDMTKFREHLLAREITVYTAKEENANE